MNPSMIYMNISTTSNGLEERIWFPEHGLQSPPLHAFDLHPSFYFLIMLGLTLPLTVTFSAHTKPFRISQTWGHASPPEGVLFLFSSASPFFLAHYYVSFILLNSWIRSIAHIRTIAPQGQNCWCIFIASTLHLLGTYMTCVELDCSRI
jgi:hypothetical protein